jgi:hypothetical protein
MMFSLTLFRAWPVLRPVLGIQWYFRGFIFKGICSQDIFLGIGKFSLQGLSQLQALEESMGRFTHYHE